MSTNNPGLPMIATSNGWTPMPFFDYGANYARQQKFLIWMADGKGNEWFEVARMQSRRIVREWAPGRHHDGVPDEQMNALQSVAFRLVEGPDRRALYRIAQRCSPHFPLERTIPQPKLKFVVTGTRRAELESQALTSV